MSQKDRRGRPHGSQQGGDEAGQRQAQGGPGADQERSAAGSNYGDWSGNRGVRESGPAGQHRDNPGCEPGNYGGQDYGNSGQPGSGGNPPGRPDMGSTRKGGK